jgi:hypothetical protein
VPLKAPEAVLRAALVADATVSGLIASRIYPLMSSPETPLPFVLWRRTAARREQTLATPMGVPITTVEYSVYAATYEAARTIADAMRAVLDGYGGTADNTTVRQTSLDDESDELANLAGGPMPDTYVVRQSYEILWQET